MVTSMKKSTIRRLEAPFSEHDSDAEIWDKVAAYYQRDLAHDATALAFLEARQISAKAVAQFRVGVANRTLGLLLPNKNRKRGAALRARLEALGVLRESGHEHLRGAIVVPLVDREGRIVSLYGRKLEERYGGEHFFTAASGAPRGLFNGAGLAGERPIVIAGSVLDALAIGSAGFSEVTAVDGALGSLDELLAALEASRASRVILAIARRTELVQRTYELSEEISSRGFEVLRAVLPGSLDVSELLAAPDGAYKLGQALRSAEWVCGVARRAEGGAAACGAARCGPAAPPAPTPASTPSPEAGEVFVRGDRRWRIRGLADNRARGTLKLNVLVTRDDGGFHVDSFDLYSARHRKAYLHQAALELGAEEAVLKKDLGQILLSCEQAQEAMLQKLHAPEAATPELSASDKAAALELLCDPKLLERVLEAFAAMGIVGERDNLLAGYLVAVSRKLPQPLALVIQSSSAAGKTALLEAIVATVPDEERASYAAVSGQSLFYMGKRSLRHRLLSIAEEAGAEKASHALKLLQSSKELLIASTGKDHLTGRITLHEYKVEGPVALMITTSKVVLDDELSSRALVVGVDESPSQTEAVHEAQRRAQTLEGKLLAERAHELVRLHHNAQRLLRPIAVVNPYASEVGFADRRVRARREHQKLLSLIEAIALMHQHQRPLRQHVELGVRTLEYIEATRDDVALAERLMAAVGGATEDELPPRTRELVQELASYVEQRLREGSGRRPLLFSRREIREALGWGDTQLKIHLRRLVDAELVLVHRADHGRGIAYELAFSERSGQAGGATGGAESGQGRAEVGPRSAPASESNRADLQREPPSTVERAESALPGLQATAPRAAVSQAS
jgi:DNA primase